MLSCDEMHSSSSPDNDKNFIEDAPVIDDNKKWPLNEQTEPLNLSINKPIISKNNDEDVIFVEEYKKTKNNIVKGPILPIRKRSRRVIIKDCPPRRNPIRRARNSKRFQDFTNSSLSDDDFISGDVDNESEFALINSDFKDKSTKINPTKKRAIIETADMSGLEALVCNNFIEMKNFVKNMKAARIIKGKFDENEWKQQCHEVINIVKYQGILLALIKGVEKVEILKYWAN